MFDIAELLVVVVLSGPVRLRCGCGSGGGVHVDPVDLVVVAAAARSYGRAGLTGAA